MHLMADFCRYRHFSRTRCQRAIYTLTHRQARARVHTQTTHMPCTQHSEIHHTRFVHSWIPVTMCRAVILVCHCQSLSFQLAFANRSNTCVRRCRFRCCVAAATSTAYCAPNVWIVSSSSSRKASTVMSVSANPPAGSFLPSHFHAHLAVSVHPLLPYNLSILLAWWWRRRRRRRRGVCVCNCPYIW